MPVRGNIDTDQIRGAGDATKFLCGTAPPTWATPAGGVAAGGVVALTANYAASSGDSGKLLTFSSAGAVTLTLPSPPPSSTWYILVENTGAGALTVSRNGLQIDGRAADLTVNQDQGVLIYTDGTNYFTDRGIGVAVLNNGTLVSTRRQINLIPGTNVTLSVADDAANNRVNVTINSSGGGGGSSFSPPLVGAYGWVNQGNAAATNSFGPLDLTNTNSGGAWSMNCLTRAIPAAPYRFAALIEFISMGNTDARGGIVLRDSASGKLCVFEVFCDINGWRANSDNLNSPTSISGSNFTPRIFLGAPGAGNGAWMAISDDGTNRKFELGIGDVSKVYWFDIVTQSRTNFLTPDQIGYAIQADTGGQGCALRVLHESTSL